MNLAQATILIADDEPELLDIFSAWLSRSGCIILTAVNGAEALKILIAQPIDALISDMRMPIMDGLSLVRKLAELRIHVPSIIFISGFGDTDVREAYALGVEAMIAKPFNRQQLLSALEHSLMERNELWTESGSCLPVQSVLLRFSSLSHALATATFAIGRGGCSFYSAKMLTVDQPVKLSFHFDQENSSLDALALVRWHSPKEERTGAEFVYLDPACRSWVIGRMQDDARFSFIPR